VIKTEEGFGDINLGIKGEFYLGLRSRSHGRREVKGEEASGPNGSGEEEWKPERERLRS
jgi:hypothetical protein